MLKHHKFTKISVQEMFLVVCVLLLHVCMVYYIRKLCMSMFYILVNFPLAWLC